MGIASGADAPIEVTAACCTENVQLVYAARNEVEELAVAGLLQMLSPGFSDTSVLAHAVVGIWPPEGS